jgi:L-asparaginase II
VISSGTFALENAVELAVVERNGFEESRHAGSAVVVDARGAVLLSLGDMRAPVFARSCLKPLQAIAVLEAGVTLSPVQTVLSTASHAGTPRHVEVVRSMLALAGLDESQLGCPADWPADGASRTEVVLRHGSAERIFMNCSGKHAAMLLACAKNGWPLESYLEPEHPLQRAIVEVVERYTGEAIAFSGVDGCGAPVHAVSLVGLATGISRVAQAHDGYAAQLTESVLHDGWAIDGPGRANTLVVERLGVIAKLGAEGVMVMATREGTTVALKILDGNLRAASIVALTLLVRAGALTQAAVDSLLPLLELTVHGGGRPVGSIRVTA